MKSLKEVFSPFEFYGAALSFFFFPVWLVLIAFALMALARFTFTLNHLYPIDIISEDVVRLCAAFIVVVTMIFGLMYSDFLKQYNIFAVVFFIMLPFGILVRNVAIYLFNDIIHIQNRQCVMKFFSRFD